MKIYFKQTGGFLGQTRSAQVDLDTFEIEVQSNIKQMVRKAGLNESFENKRDGLRDATCYEIAIEQDGELREYRFDETYLRGEYIDLLEFLQSSSSSVEGVEE